MNPLINHYNKKKKVGNLPVNYGEIKAKETMDKAFNKEFINSILERENQKSKNIDDLNDLFEKEDDNMGTMREVYEEELLKDANDFYRKYYSWFKTMKHEKNIEFEEMQMIQRATIDLRFIIGDLEVRVNERKHSED